MDDVSFGAQAMEKQALQAEGPFGEKGAGTHALLVGFQGEGGSSVGGAHGFDCDEAEAGWDGLFGVLDHGVADFVFVVGSSGYKGHVKVRDGEG